MKIVEYSDRDLMMMALADTIASELNTVLHGEEQATLVVPGGTTPGPVFDTLSTLHLDWGRVNVMLSDERWVPETSDRSNTRLIRQRLLTDQAARATLVPLFAEGQTADSAMAELGQGVEAALPISVAVLGMGADMHTASLFPGADRLAEALEPHAPPLMPMRAPGAPEPRITLTARVLNGALNKHILITGGEKRAALERAAATHDHMAAPVSAILRNTTVHWAD